MRLAAFASRRPAGGGGRRLAVGERPDRAGGVVPMKADVGEFPIGHRVERTPARNQSRSKPGEPAWKREARDGGWLPPDKGGGRMVDDHIILLFPFRWLDIDRKSVV